MAAERMKCLVESYVLQYQFFIKYFSNGFFYFDKNPFLGIYIVQFALKIQILYFFERILGKKVAIYKFIFHLCIRNEI